MNDLLDARITETIATTRDEDGETNAAPMGVLKKEDGVYARLWEGSKTLENVRTTEHVVVNFTRDPVVYVETALGDDGGEFVVDGHLRDADGWVRCDAKEVDDEESEDVTRWRLAERERNVVERVLPTHSRGFASVIEATVHATRLSFKPELRELVEHHLEIARKCGGEREREAAELIEKHV